MIKSSSACILNRTTCRARLLCRCGLLWCAGGQTDPNRCQLLARNQLLLVDIILVMLLSVFSAPGMGTLIRKDAQIGRVAAACGLPSCVIQPE